MEIEYSNFQLDEETFGKNELVGIIDKHYDFIYNKVYDIRKLEYKSIIKAKTYIAIDRIANKDITEKLIGEFEITEEMLSKRLKDLSSGELIRILILKLCIGNSKVIILDHIDAYLNHRDLQNILSGIKRYSDTLGKTFLFRSNNIENVIESCSRYIIVRDGNIVYNGNDINELPEKTDIMRFVDLANNKKAKLQYYKDPSDLLKAIYRSVKKWNIWSASRMMVQNIMDYKN